MKTGLSLAWFPGRWSEVPVSGQFGTLPPRDACRVPSVPAACARAPGSLPVALPAAQGQKRSASLGSRRRPASRVDGVLIPPDSSEASVSG